MKNRSRGQHDRQRPAEPVQPPVAGGVRPSRLLLLLAVVVGVVVVGLLAVPLLWRGRDAPPGETSRQPGLPRLGPREWPDGSPNGLESADRRPASTNGAKAADIEDEAMRVAKRLGERFPEGVEALDVMASVHQAFGRTAKAIRCWEECARRVPEASAGFYVSMACVAVDRGEDERAAALFRKALAKDPASWESRAGLADALVRLGRPEEAIELLEGHLTGGVRSLPCFTLLGQAHLQLGHYDKAKEYLEAAVKMAPDYSDAYYGLATACARLGEKQKAAEYQQQFRRLKEADEEGRREALEDLPQGDMALGRLASIYRLAAQVYERHGQVREAEEHLRRAAAVDPADTRSRQALAGLYQRQNRPGETLAVLEELRRIDPENTIYDHQIGVTHARAGQFDAAEEAFRRVMARAPDRSRGYAALAQLYVRSDRKIAEARRLAQTAVQLEPIARNYSILSAACDKDGDLPGALSAIERAVELEPGNPDYQRMRRSIRESL